MERYKVKGLLESMGVEPKTATKLAGIWKKEGRLLPDQVKKHVPGLRFTLGWCEDCGDHHEELHVGDRFIDVRPRDIFHLDWSDFE